MCYPCTECNRCGKLTVGSPTYVPPPTPKCFMCGGDVSSETGVCTQCGVPAFNLPGTGDGQRKFSKHD